MNRWHAVFAAMFWLVLASTAEAGQRWVPCAPQIPVHEANLDRLSEVADECLTMMRNLSPPSYLCRWGADEEEAFAAADECGKALGVWAEAVRANPRSVIKNNGERDEAVALLERSLRFFEKLKVTSERQSETVTMAAAFVACATPDEGFDPADIEWLRCENQLPTRLLEDGAEEAWRARFSET